MNTLHLPESTVLRKIIFNGFLTGLVLQVAIGPVFFLIINLSLQQDLVTGLSAVAVVTFVDYLYIALAIAGAGKIFEKVKTAKILDIGSSLILILIGLLMIKSTIGAGTIQNMNHQPLGTLSVLTTIFMVTFTNPLTIVFWTTVFTAKTVEYSLTKKELLFFGLAAGSATALFLGLSTVAATLLKTSIPVIIIPIAHTLVGLVLIFYGMWRMSKFFLPYKHCKTI